MKPPKAPGIGNEAEMSDLQSAVLSCVGVQIETLKNRPDFLKAAQARRQGTGGFLLQARPRGDETALIRVGFTASKKIGNAVLRNRAKRRLRALVRLVLPERAQQGWDYVLVAKPAATISRLFSDLQTDLEAALEKVHRGRT